MDHMPSMSNHGQQTTENPDPNLVDQQVFDESAKENGIQDDDQRMHSFVNVKGSWLTRKISLVGAAKSVVFQLKLGQNMTRISFPAAFLAPASILEMAAYQMMHCFPILYKIQDEPCPIKRILIVTEWYLACFIESKFDHKPYNPVINESHRCFINSNGIRTNFYAEQVSHHPPVSAFYITCPDISNLQLHSNCSFNIRFLGNGVMVQSDGGLQIRVKDEVYQINKSAPNMMISNVIIGTRTANWLGDIVIECHQTKCKVEMNMKSHNVKEWVDGRVTVINPHCCDNPNEDKLKCKSSTSKDKRRLQFSGNWTSRELICKSVLKAGHSSFPKFNYGNTTKKNGKPLNTEGLGKTNNECPEEEVKSCPLLLSSYVLFDPSKIQPAKIYYPRKDEIEPSDSLCIWKDVSKAIVDGDLMAADTAKKDVEEAQRELLKAHKNAIKSLKHKFFEYDRSSKTWKWIEDPQRSGP